MIRPAPFPDFLSGLAATDRRPGRVAAMLAAGPALAVLLAIPAASILTGALAGQAPETGHRLARSAVFLLVLAGGLGGMALGVLLAAKLIFRRPMRSWITAAPRFRWPMLLWAAAFACPGLGLLMAADALLLGGRPELPILEPAPAGVRTAYAASLAAGFLLVAAAEEAVFRGYLLQQIAAFTRRPWLVIGASSLAFSLIHLEFDAVAVISRMVTGAAFAWAALRLGGLEFAMGAHLANNLMIGLIEAPLLPEDVAEPGDLTQVVVEVLLAAYLVAGVELTRRLPRLARLGGGMKPASLNSL